MLLHPFKPAKPAKPDQNLRPALRAQARPSASTDYGSILRTWNKTRALHNSSLAAEKTGPLARLRLLDWKANIFSKMESTWKTEGLLIPRQRIRLLICLLIGISTVFGFLMFNNMHDYMPWYRRIPKALVRTSEVHLGLWLATLEIRSRWRFLVALLLIPSGVGAYLLLWNYSLLTIVAAATGLGWLLYKVVRGDRLDD